MSMANIFIQMIQQKEKDHKWQRGHIFVYYLREIWTWGIVAPSIN